MRVERVLAFLMVALIVCAPAALATSELTLSSGITNIAVQDGTLFDSNPTVGAITFIGAVGNYNINVSTGLASAVGGAGHLDLNSVDKAIANNVSASGLLYIFLSEDNLTTPAGGWDMKFGGTLADAGLGSTVKYDAFYDGTNVLTSTNQLIGTLGPFGTGAFAGATFGAVSVTTPYSLTQRITLNGVGEVIYSGNAELSPVPVPEPSSLLLLGCGMIGLAGWVRARRK